MDLCLRRRPGRTDHPQRRSRQHRPDRAAGPGDPTSPARTSPRAAFGSAAAGTYTVVSGDTLFTIAAAHRVPGGWPALYQANRDVISDPAAIYPGQVLRLG